MFLAKKIKYAIILIGLCYGLQGYGCVCSHNKFMEKYVRSDFVAHITIIKNFRNLGSSYHYKSNIVIKQLFKGNNVKSVLIEGSSDGKNRTSCDIFFEEGTEMLVYARLDGAGQYTFDSCSGYRVLTHPVDSGQDRELKMLDFLNQDKIKKTDKTLYGVNLHDKLARLKGIETNRTFAIYEITFGNELNVDTIKTVTGFNRELDENLISILKQASWVVTASPEKPRDKISGSKLLFGFYYYPALTGYESFISEWDL